MNFVKRIRPVKDKEAPKGQENVPDGRKITTPGKKLLIGVLLLALVSGLFAGLFLFKDTSINMVYSMESRAAQMKALSGIVERDLDLLAMVRNDNEMRNMEKLSLTASAFWEQMLEEADGKPVLYGDGAVVRVTENGVECPEGFPQEIIPDPEGFGAEGGIVLSLPSDSSDQEHGWSALLWGVHRD